MKRGMGPPKGMKMNGFEKVFFQVASPITLASLVRDTMNGTPAQQLIAIDAFKALEAIVGFEEAKRMIME